ncbi:MAG: FtsX-like permease family protein [Peptococcaceae bacterium]|nr:FtsX-like permease family protein [Peptococcaceae bacterium]
MKKDSLGSLRVRLWFSMQMAAHGIMSNFLRSALTVLGVTIGVASVVALMGIGEGARVSVMDQFESLGSNVVVVKASKTNYYFAPSYAVELQERVPTLSAVTPVVYGNVNMKWRRTKTKVDVLGVNEDFPFIRDQGFAAGQNFTFLHVEQRAPVVLLGSNLASKLMNGRSPVGQTISINGLDYRILGVLAAKGEGKADGIDDKIVMPYTSALKVLNTKKIPEIWGKAPDTNSVELSVVQLSRIIRKELRLDGNVSSVGGGGDMEGGEASVDVMVDGDIMIEEPMPAPMPDEGDGSSGSSSLLGEDLPVTVTSLNQMVQEADNANRVMTLLLGGIAAVSLLVGGLGIMNIMLVAVTERTGEIGVRRALGARQSDLIIQFVLEAIYLSAIGAFLGVVFGVIGLGIFDQYGFHTAVNAAAIQVAVFMAIGCGLIFGVYPAVSASSIPPVEALRRN